MKYRKIFGVLLTSLIFFGVGKTVYADTKEELEKTRESVYKITEEVNINTLKLSDLQDKILKIESEIEDKSKEIERQDLQISEEKKQLEENYRDLQVNDSKRSIVSIIFEGESFSDVAKKLVAKSAVTKAKQNRIDSVKAKSEEVSKEKDELLKKKEEMSASKQELEKIEESLEKKKIKLEGTVATLEKTYATELDEERVKLSEKTKELQSNGDSENRNEEKKDNGSDKEIGSVESTVGETIVETASQFVGTPYVYGGSSPDGFDCSGFVGYVYSLHGISLPRTSGQQSLSGVQVSLSSLMPGDILYWGGTGGSAYHVGIYVGNNTYIHASTYGVPLGYAEISSYYMPSGAVRVL